MVSPTGPLPLRMGVVTLVMWSPRTPLSLAVASTGAEGAVGAVASIVRARAPEAAETLPAASVKVAVRLFDPDGSVLLVTDQVPLAATVAVPTTLVPSSRVTVSPAIPVPVMTGLVSLVMSSPCTPVSLAAESAGVAGAAGAAVSMASASAGEAGELLPAGSVCTVVRLCMPAASGLVLTDHVPSAATIAEPITVVPSSRVTVSPAVPVPVMTGVVTLVMPSPLVPLSLAVARTGADEAAGVAVSMVRPRAADGAEALPAASVCTAVMLRAPDARVAVAIDHVPVVPTIPLPMVVVPS